MKLVRNQGADRVADLLTEGMAGGRNLDLVTSELSLPGFAVLRDRLEKLTTVNLIVTGFGTESPAQLLGSRQTGRFGILSRCEALQYRAMPG